MHRLLACLVVAAAAAGSVGCTAPLTTYRNTGLVPSARPIAFDGRTPHAETLSLEGTIDDVSTVTNTVPRIHDTALNVAQWSGEASAMFAVSNVVQLGLRGELHTYDASNGSAVGTMPLPDHPVGWGLGPEIRVAVPLDEQRRFALGFAANVMAYHVPWAAWQLGCANGATTCAIGGDGETTFNAADGLYSLKSEDSETHLVYTLGIYPSFALGDEARYGHFYAMLGATNGFANDGFTDTPSGGGSTITTTGPLFMVGGGYGVTLGMLHAQMMFFMPIDARTTAVDNGPGLQLSLGVNFDLSGSTDAAAPTPADPREETRVEARD